jgi:outer membrane protein TolC
MLTLNLGVRRERRVDLGLPSTHTLLTGGVSVPLPLWGIARGHVAETQGQWLSAKASLEALKTSWPARREAAQTRFRLAQETEATYRPLSIKVTHALQVVEQGFVAGQLSLLEYQTKRDALYRARLDAVSAQQERVIAQTELTVLLTPGGEIAP